MKLRRIKAPRKNLTGAKGCAGCWFEGKGHGCAFHGCVEMIYGTITHYIFKKAKRK